MKGKLNGLSLFSGYGGIDLALEEYVETKVFCEIEKYAQAILLSRMDDGTFPFAPIWNDITTLDAKQLRGIINIVLAGFPCQDISVAGKGKGLDGKRSGLFFEVIRVCEEASPEFIFLENVPAIRTRGSIEVQEALASIGYDCRFGMLSAAEVGANHRRDRFFCLAIRRDLPDSYRSELRIKSGGGPQRGRERFAYLWRPWRRRISGQHQRRETGRTTGAQRNSRGTVRA
jgi:DNA (cytosine-5)-methyltransferase 1